MNYETAEKLKDAGFPQGGDGHFMFPNGDILGFKTNEDHLYIPSLEELIEACGDDFISLVVLYDRKNWRASAYEIADRIEVLGSTPIEAVANLWLALNGKNEISKE